MQTKYKFAIVVNKDNINNRLVIFILKSYKNAIQDSNWSAFWKDAIQSKLIVLVVNKI